MNSPYVRRLRLGMELRELRTERNMTQARAGRLIGKSRMEISRLENGQSADPADVLNLLEALGVEGDRWTALVTIARDAGEIGWWDSVKHIGDRQALSANLEAGAIGIRQYQQTYLPGLLQLPEYVRSIHAAPAALEPVSGTVDGFLTGRLGRQRNLRRPGGPSLEVIVDELAILRRTAPASAFRPQLGHLVGVAKGSQPNVTLRVLPVTAEIRDYAVPRGSFSIYAYLDPGDPQVVAIEQVISESVLLQTRPTCDDLVHASRVRGCAYARRPRSRVRAHVVHELSLGYGELSHPRACARARLRALGTCSPETKTMRQSRSVTMSAECARARSCARVCTYWACPCTLHLHSARKIIGCARPAPTMPVRLRR